MSERRMMTRIEHISHMSLADVINRADILIADNPHLTLDSIEVGTETEWDITYPTLEYESLETDGELKRRLEWEKDRQYARRKQYEDLKKEFERG